PADPRRREPGFDRDAAGIRDRVGGDPGAAPARAEPAAGVQDPLGLVRGPGRSLLGRVPDEVATVADVGAADSLVRDRDGALLRVRRVALEAGVEGAEAVEQDRKSTRLNSSHQIISYAVFCLKKKNHSN